MRRTTAGASSRSTTSTTATTGRRTGPSSSTSAARRRCGATSGAGSIIGELAALHGAAVFAVEHRYYGDSLPFTLLDLPNLAYLNSGQALLDIVAFRGFAAAQLAQRHGDAAAGGGPWVAFGGSYAGALATWLRLKYPHLITGALASSAVVRAVESYTDFDLHLGRTVGHECASALRAANLAVDARLAKSPKASATVKASFDAAALSDGALRLLPRRRARDGRAVRLQGDGVRADGGGAARGHDLVTALANFTTSFFYPTLEQGGSREYDAAYLAVEQIDPAMTGRQWRVPAVLRGGVVAERTGEGRRALTEARRCLPEGGVCAHLWARRLAQRERRQRALRRRGAQSHKPLRPVRPTRPPPLSPSHHEQVDQPHVDEADPLRRLLQLAGALAERRVDLLHRHPALERLGVARARAAHASRSWSPAQQAA